MTSETYTARRRWRTYDAGRGRHKLMDSVGRGPVRRLAGSFSESEGLVKKKKKMRGNLLGHVGIDMSAPLPKYNLEQTESEIAFGDGTGALFFFAPLDCPWGSHGRLARLRSWGSESDGDGNQMMSGRYSENHQPARAKREEPVSPGNLFDHFVA